ncbi:M56 family metallopeptidase [Gelidibacter sp. F63206]|uniref:M56 family metallopeptidase n=1 Tax=Gelidibacter sp. F63206 TaxID=2926425 RepID=UPI001FF66052|nr:M56 family metallopeptidase [Gelidibacter sp. F63206]MCK0114571.1 M56 family metallopeptidase [Gelidibacter sp. F63206]
MLHYILQTVAFQVFFLIIYDVFLKNETFFNWNRAYLIGTACLSFILPFLKFESIKAIVPEPMVVRLPEVIIGDVSPTFDNAVIIMGSEQVTEQAASFSWTYVWIAGIILATLLLTYKIVKIGRLLYKNPRRWQGDALIVFLLNSSAAFSFFHYIFLGTNISAEKKEHILQHEMVHVKEKHSWDLLVFEMLRIVFWFNPLIYIYQNKLSNLHEFIADAKAVKYKGKSAYYQSLLSQVFETQHISFINPFFKQSLTRLNVFGKQFTFHNGQIKKRIVMLSKSRSKQIRLIKYALLVPMVMGMLMYTSSYASIIRDPFPVFQNEALDQELTFKELVDKYYNEIIEMSTNDNKMGEAYNRYGKNTGSYIQSEIDLAKNIAFRKYMLMKIRDKKKAAGELKDGESDQLMNPINTYSTYEEYLDYKKTDLAKQSWESKAPMGAWRLVVDDMRDLTEAEKKRKEKLIDIIKKDDFYHTLVMTDGKITTSLDFVKKNKEGEKEDFESYDIEVPFAVIEEVPLFEGCEASGSKDDDKRCTSDKVAQFVNTNFNIDIATENNLKGRQRINVIFKIDKDGKIRDVMARAPHPALEAEAVRVIQSMPDFTPGKQKGKTVTVPYSLPILFQVQGDDVNAEKAEKKIAGDADDIKEVVETRDQNTDDQIEVPYAVIEEVPLFEGCEASGSKDDAKRCTSDKVSQFVNKNFNVDLATALGLTGRQRINVIFKIGEDGKVRNVRARASHPGLEAEAVRVIQSMPDFTPGKQRGKTVTVPYSLPILFQVQDDAPDTSKESTDQSEQEYLKTLEANEQNKILGLTEIPYAVVDEVPVFPSCESLDSNEDLKQCTSDKIASFVNKNFNTKLAKELGLTGTQRMNVIFKIGTDGRISNIRARAKHPELEKEAVRVIGILPKMLPGKQRGKAVTVSYSLPIIFNVNE